MNRRNYELIAFDMDGTLLTSEKTLSPVTLAAIAEATGRGDRAAVASGRSLTQMYDYLPQLLEVGIRYSITGNGALVYDSQLSRILYKAVLTSREVATVVEAFRPEGDLVMVETFSDGAFTVDERQIPRMGSYGMGVYQAMFDRLAERVDDMPAYMLDGDARIEKVNLHFSDLDALDRVLHRLDGSGLETSVSEVWSIEVTPKGVSKGAGLLALADKLGIDRERTVGVGDGGNDLSLVRDAGLGVAMGNATGELKSAADVVVRDNDHDGCAEAVLRFMA